MTRSCESLSTQGPVLRGMSVKGSIRLTVRTNLIWVSVMNLNVRVTQFCAFVVLWVKLASRFTAVHVPMH